MSADRYVEHECPWLYAERQLLQQTMQNWQAQQNMANQGVGQWNVIQPNQLTNVHTEAQDMRKRPFDQVANGQGVDVASEIPVTEEMVAAGLATFGDCAQSNDEVLAASYRAMAALAPKDDTALHLAALLREAGCERLGQKDRIAALEAENTALRLQLAAQAPAAFGTDTPDRPKRPDGTLAPVARPLPVVTQRGDGRRVGG